MIGKTRQPPGAQIERAFDDDAGFPRGVLQGAPAAGTFRHTRRTPPPDLAFWIDHFWSVEWNLRNCEPHVAETLPHPNFQLIFEESAATISGVYTGRFSRILAGQSSVFGIKFHAGAFRPFLQAAATTLANRTIPASEVFGDPIDTLAAVVSGLTGDDARIEAAGQFLRSCTPAKDPVAAQARQLADLILENRDIASVDDLACRSGVAKRTLQRIFHQYVGASPKWVIRRYRLHELVERFRSGVVPDWPQIALELGYFDQAHLINDFRSMAGYSPGKFLQIARQNP